MRFLSVIGTRPEGIKMAPVIRALSRIPHAEAHVCTTAQHREMLDQVLDLFQIKPDYDLGVMRDDQTLAQLGSAIFLGLDPVFAEFRPDWVLVEGDTTTVAMAALLAYYRRIRVGHVEAGLRTHNKWSPFPEEINRRVAGVAADLHFAPTEMARQNLLREGIPESMIVVTGNPVIDALLYAAQKPAPANVLELLARLGVGRSLEGSAAPAPRLVLVTAHRRESFGAPLESIFRGLQQLAGRGDIEIVYPVHLNPNVRAPAWRILGDVPHVTLLPPQDYLSLVHLMKHSALILTDSGGIQEEAPSLGKPVLVLRETTERPEGIEAGTLQLVGTATDRIVEQASRLLDDGAEYARMAHAANPFGDGHAADKIARALTAFDAQ